MVTREDMDELKIVKKNLMNVLMKLLLNADYNDDDDDDDDDGEDGGDGGDGEDGDSDL